MSRSIQRSGALAQWLMPNDFQPRICHRFHFRTSPQPGFDGIVHCEVIELDPPHRLAITWRGGPVDTVARWTLEPLDRGRPQLRFEHSGFEGIKGAQSPGIELGGLHAGTPRRSLGEHVARYRIERYAGVGRDTAHARVDRVDAGSCVGDNRVTT
jgi:hypothetical protein